MIRGIILSCLLITSYSFAMTKAEIKPRMSVKIDRVLNIVQDANLEKNKKREEIVSILDSLFDYDLMARLSLGRVWNDLNKEQKEKFIKLFSRRLKDSYVDKLYLYTNEVVELLGTEQPKTNRIVLKTQLIGKSEKYMIDYKFYEKSSDDWLIYDVSLLGVSIIQTYRQQFAGFLKDKTFEDLIVNLSTNQTQPKDK